MREARVFSAISVVIGVIILSLVASASAATVHYRNDTTKFDPVGFFDTQQSTITVPGGRTPVAKVELPSVQMAATNPDGADLSLALVGPAGTTPAFDLIGPNACLSYNPGDPTNFTDSGQPIGLAACAGDRKPEDPRTLALFNGGPSSGTWTMLVDDDNNDPNSDVSFFGWGLRITHAPFVFAVKAKKQPLRKKVKLSATCNAKCTITSSGDVKARSLVQAKDVNVKFKLPLKARAFERLEDGGGKAKFTLVASDGYGDLSTQKVKVRFPG
jgi:hypothetical protein